jgi:NAD(P)-dependent dehydrogenase (short-subunit alcohol dehydrogenase family)
MLTVLAITHRNELANASKGSHVFDVTSDRKAESLVRTLVCDLTSESEIIRTIQFIASFVSSVDYVINAAGDGRFLGPTTDAMMLMADVRKQFDLLVFAPALEQIPPDVGQRL